VSENGLVPRDIGPGLVRPGMAEDILAVVLTLEQEDDIARLWDGATTFDAAVEKFQGYRDEQHELRRSNAYCEIQLGHLLGPNPGAGPGRGKKGSAQNLLIPKEIRSKLRRFYGYRDDLVALVRTDPTMVYREERLKWVARQEANARTKEARARAATDALPTAVLLLGEADARALPLADDTVDLIVTSPPYGLDIAYDGGDVAAEAWPSFMAAWLAEALREAVGSARAQRPARHERADLSSDVCPGRRRGAHGRLGVPLHGRLGGGQHDQGRLGARVAGVGGATAPRLAGRDDRPAQQGRMGAIEHECR
jgi:hypothetical protein